MNRYPTKPRYIQCATLAVAIAGLAFAALLSADEEPATLNRGADVSSPTTSMVEYSRLAGKRAGQMRDDNGLRMKLAWCPPGAFTAENRLLRENVELPVMVEKPENDDVAVDEFTGETVRGNVLTTIRLKVILTRGFWLGKYEVTRSQWQQIMHTEPWANRKVVVEGGDFPATYVSWNEATEFCRRFTDGERNAGRLPVGWQYSLPTEAQWEHACRANTRTEFSFGDDESVLDEYAWFRANTHDVDEPYPHRVGQKKPNQWGLHDMYGNVAEWCRDWWGLLPGGLDPEIDKGDPRRLQKVQRGGDWRRSELCCNSRSRDMAPPELRKLEFGFRVALSAIR